MSEELENTGGSEPQEQTQEKQYSAIEQKALDQGWRPKEEFDGDPDAFIDAPEFVRRGELFSKIEHQSKELKAVKAALDALKTHHSRVKEVEYDRALKALQNARKQALVDGETERFLELEQRIEEVKEEKQEFDNELKSVQADPVRDINPEFTQWIDRNAWYETSKPMRAYADKLGVELAQEGHSPSQVLQMVEREVKKEFAHKFQNQKAGRPQAVEASARSGGKADSFQLSDDERTIMRKLVRAGAMSEAEYISELKKTR
jgi:hypothetical protein